MLDFNTASRQQGAGAPLPRPLNGTMPVEVFRRFLLEHGLRPDAPIVPTEERVQRCPVEGDRTGQHSGWYVFFADRLPAGEAGNWKTGESWKWCAKEEHLLTSAEWKIAGAHLERAKMARERERARLAEEAASRARSMWARAQPCEAHPYLSAKCTASYGLRVLAGKLLIPVMDMAGTLRSLQKIDAGGKKEFLFGGATRGGSYTIPGKPDMVAVAEGYATAASIHAATGWTVLVAFNCGNLLPVAKAWKAGHPEARMVICGDDDRSTKSGNAGRLAAEACARETGASVLFPQFRSDDKKSTDWNDLHTREGMEEVKRQLFAPFRSYTIAVEDWVLRPETFTVAPEPRRDLVENTLPLGAVVLLASLGGIGKSMKMLDLALQVAGEPAEAAADGMDFNGEPMFFGNRILEHGPAVIYTAEDANRDNQDRIYKMGRPFPRYPVSVIPIIDVVGSYPLILPGDRNGPVTSPHWDEVREQLLKIRPKLVVFDPLSSFALLDLNKPEVATFAIGMFANLASETGACILVTHHLAKTKDNITTPEQARALVRGSTAIVDRTRGTYVLWGLGEKQAKHVCTSLGEEWERDKVIQGCLAKENFGGDKSIKTFVRRKNGLLVVRNADLASAARENVPALLESLELACADAARRGQPFTRTGANGLFARRQELPAMLKGISRHQLENAAQKLLDAQRLVLCISKGSTSKKWLDVPDGDFALGIGEIAKGATEKIMAGAGHE